MIRNKATVLSVALLVVGLIIGAVVGMVATPPTVVEKEVIKEVPKEVIVEVPKEVIKEVPKEVIKEVPVEVVREIEIEKEVPMKLSVLAEKIRNGEIDVGEAYGMALDQRYHRIHATVIGLKCTTCHVEEVPPEVIFAQTPSEAPGPVDRRVCLGCHLTGPAFNLYGSELPTPSPTPTPTPTPIAPPMVPVDHAGRTTCFVCHKTGVAGAPQFPSSHENYADEINTCLGCHKSQ